MDENFLRTQRDVLEKEKTKIEKDLGQMKKYPDYGSSGESKIMELEDYQNELGLGKNFSFLLKETNEALKRIEKGIYGICEKCGDEIESGRLKAFPAAAFCSTCANKK